MKRRNKKGLIGILLFFAALFLILIVAFIASIVVGVGGWASNLVTVEMQGIGSISPSVNMSDIAESTFVPLNITIQNLKWVLGFVFVCALLMSLGFGASHRVSPNPFLIGLYFILMILLIFGAIIMSNMYEDIYSGNDLIAESLQSQPVTSYFILYSPFILTLIALITGIYMFARPSAEGGGFGI